MLKVFYSPIYVGAAHTLETTRKAGWIADSLDASPIPGLRLLEPASLTREQVAQVHDPKYIRAVELGKPRKLAVSQGFCWDAGVWPMVLASNGGAVAAGLAALIDGVAGSLSSGLHHARREEGRGYCTFNGLVLAAHAALAAGARSVLILDLDAHCGGGTESMIRNDRRIWQADVSVDFFDNYESSDQISLRLVTQSETYLPIVKDTLNAIHRRGNRFDLCLYNAGMDPHEHCSTGGMNGITQDVLAQRERLVFEWCRSRHLPVAFVLAGGYTGPQLNEAGLVDLHRLTLSAVAAARSAWPPLGHKRSSISHKRKPRSRQL